MARIKVKIRQRISQILDVLIPENRWEQYVELLDRDGKPSRKQLIAIFMSMCQHMETLENLYEDLAFQIEMLEGSKNKQSVRVTEEGFKLRTPLDVTDDLEKQLNPDTKAFYISTSDWEIMGKTIDSKLAATKPQYGYGKEVDPKDGKTKTCLYYKDIPIFKLIH